MTYAVDYGAIRCIYFLDPPGGGGGLPGSPKQGSYVLAETCLWSQSLEVSTSPTWRCRRAAASHTEAVGGFFAWTPKSTWKASGLEARCINYWHPPRIHAYHVPRRTYVHPPRSTLPQIKMEAHRGPYIEDSSLIVGPSPLPC